MIPRKVKFYCALLYVISDEAIINNVIFLWTPMHAKRCVKAISFVSSVYV